jgi:ubiquinone/menaquinone biosynthesis C-methylase UbiE
MGVDEYLGESGEHYEPLTRGKRFLLMPAISRNCPPAPGPASQFLDVACGTGIMSSIAMGKGYCYTGIDLSETLIKRAMRDHPGRYVLGSATTLSKQFSGQRFETILISMLLPALGKWDEVVGVLKEAHAVLADSGTLLIGVTHPSFDWYMQAELLQKKGVDSTFRGYFSSGVPFIIHRKDFDSHDIHWTLTDYIAALREAGLVITAIDECPPSSEADQDFIAERSRFPTYLLIVAQKRLR